MEDDRALFEPDRKAGGYVVTFQTLATASPCRESRSLPSSEFARRIGIPKTHIARLFSLRHHSRLDQIEAALRALGKRLHVEARDAA